MKNVVVITGQTATGKTSYALKRAKELSGELINADSRQMYKYLDVITGKDIPKNTQFYPLGDGFTSEFALDSYRKATVGYYFLDGVKIWAYDLVDPKEHFSSYDYTAVVNFIINNAIDKNSIPIVVGGSYLYLKHLLYGFDVNVSPNWKLRKQLERKSIKQLQNELNKLDVRIPKQLNESDRSNPRRLIRKIEIILNQSKKSNQIKHSAFNISEFTGFHFASREKLENAIRRRVELRLKHGAIEEVQSLRKKGYSKHDPGLQTIGYQQIIAFLEGNISKSEAIDQWITAEIQYAKRQYVFMKKDKNINWKDV